MNNCLVTKLKSAVDNNDLLRFNHLYITFDATRFAGDTASDKLFLMNWSDGVKRNIVVKNSAGETNIITPIYNSYFKAYALVLSNVYLNKDVWNVAIPDKNLITHINGNITTNDGREADGMRVIFNIKEFKYCPLIETIKFYATHSNFSSIIGDLSALLNCNNLTSVRIQNGKSITYTEETMTALQEKGVSVDLA